MRKEGNIMIYSNPMTNQLLRQKEQIENLIQQYNQPTPIQNFINTAGLDFEAKILSNGEDVSNIMINRRTLFVDEKNHKVVVKEMDGTISKEYEIVVPLDEKDKKILELENKLKEMELKVNERTGSTRTDDECKQSNANDNEHAQSQSIASIKPIQSTTN